MAAKYPDFPILLEATRECLNDVFDLPALREVLRDLRLAEDPHGARRDAPRRRRSRSRSCSAGSRSTCTRATHRWPSGGRPRWPSTASCSATSSVPRSSELIDPVVLGDLELELQRLVDGRRAHNTDELHDLLRTLGPFTTWELDARGRADRRRRVGGGVGPTDSSPSDGPSAARWPVEEHVAASEDAARLRDTVGRGVARQGSPPCTPTRTPRPSGRSRRALRPLATRAASGIPEFDELLDKAKEKAPARSLVSIDDVGVATAFLAHDAARLITGETLYVDGGYHIID